MVAMVVHEPWVWFAVLVHEPWVWLAMVVHDPFLWLAMVVHVRWIWLAMIVHEKNNNNQFFFCRCDLAFLIEDILYIITLSLKTLK